MSGQQQQGMGRMLITLPMVFMLSKVDLTDENRLMAARAAYVIVVLAQWAVYRHIAARIPARRSGTSNRTIWVKKQKSAFSQPEVSETTYLAHELEIATRQKNQAVTGALMMGVIHFYFGVPSVVLIQLAMIPMNMFGDPLFKVYMMGDTSPTPYGESLERPVEAAAADASSSDKFAVALSAVWESSGTPQDMEAVLSLFRSEEVPVDTQLSEEGGKWTALMVACGHKEVAPKVIVRLLSDFNADVFIADSDGWTALHWACFHGRPEAVDQLLLAAHNTDPDVDSTGVVEVASLYKSSPRVRQLVALKDVEKKTAVDNAVETGNVEVLKALQSCGVPVSKKQMTAAASNKDTKAKEAAVEEATLEDATTTEATGVRARGTENVEDID